MDVHSEQITEIEVPGKRLGRHVLHDPRSLEHLVPVRTVGLRSRTWRHYIQILDQGEVGQCTGFASTNVLGTSPWWGTLKHQRQAGLELNGGEGSTIYSMATSLDPWPGSYPPDDTGSDGLSAAKACQRLGLIKSYQHITSLDAAQSAIQTRPFIVGTNWYSMMDEPNAKGVVTVGGTVRGGHEYACIGWSRVHGMWKFVQSWGPTWGKAGYFYYTDESLTRLLSEDGDATVFLP
jgi:Papain family cysteine protease